MNRVPRAEVPCPVCGGERHTERYPDELGDVLPPVDYSFSPLSSRTYRIVSCDACGMLFTNPMPDLKGRYEETEDAIYTESSPQRLRTARHQAKRLARHMPGGRLLDLGCATGLFLDAAAERFEVEGIELSRWAGDIAARRHVIHRAPLSELGFREWYDAVTLWGVIEHLNDPAAELKAVHDALRPGGVCAIYTGDIDAWLPRLLGKRWWWFMGMHLLYFSRRTLERLCRRVGFDILGTENHRLYMQVFSLANSLNRYRVGRIVSPVLRLPGLRDVMLPLTLSGEMVMFVRKPSPGPDRVDPAGT